MGTHSQLLTAARVVRGLVKAGRAVASPPGAAFQRVTQANFSPSVNQDDSHKTTVDLGFGFLGKALENSLENSFGEADEMVQSGQSSLCKHEDLNYISRTHIKTPVIALHAFKSSSGETGAGGPPGLACQTGLPEAWPQREVDSIFKEDTGLHIHSRKYTCAYI